MFTPHPQSKQRKRSAAILAKYLLAKKKQPELTDCLRALLNTLLWKLSEAESHKHETRYQSKSAMNRRKGTKVQHDHVHQRKNVIDRLLAPNRNIDGILRKVFACTVTEREHKKLSRYKAFDGWKRYKKAGIVVTDTKTGREF
jgi:hypothetical protein